MMVMRRPPRGWCQRNAASLPHWALKPSGLAVAFGWLGKCEEFKRVGFARWIFRDYESCRQSLGQFFLKVVQLAKRWNSKTNMSGAGLLQPQREV